MTKAVADECACRGDVFHSCLILKITFYRQCEMTRILPRSIMTEMLQKQGHREEKLKLYAVFRILHDNSHKMIEPTPVGRIVTLSW